MATAAADKERVHNGRMTKIERFKWTLADQPGVLEMIDKHRLKVDPIYQRPENENKVQAMAREWSHIACGCLTVALRANGDYYVMDGGHRAVASRLRSDIKELPCIVFLIENMEMEAKGFLSANTLRKPVTAVEKFKALVVAGDPVAVRISDLLDDASYEVSNAMREDTRCIKCIRAVMDRYRDNKEVFLRVWPLILDICNGGAIGERVVESICYIEQAISRQGLTLTRDPWRSRIIRLGSRGVQDAAAAASAYYSRGGNKVWARGVVDKLNHGVRNRLILGVLEQDDSANESEGE